MKLSSRAGRPVRTLLAAALALVAAPVFAQTYSQTIFFGDSLTDSGFYRPFLVQQNPQASVLGKFTTNPGLVWSEYLANFYGTTAAPAWNLTMTGVVNGTGTNFAAGGARITLQPGFPPTPPTSFAPSLSMQINTYLARNGGRADPNALFTVWGGANDLFFHLNGLTTQAQFLSAAGQQIGLVASLQNAGARYILVPTIPDVGRTPFGLSQGAAGSAGISALVGGYNQTLFDGLAQGGLRVIPLNTFNLLREVCGPGNYPPGAPNSFAFADGVHPTTGAHEIIGDYAVSMLEGPRQLALLPHSAAMVGRARADRIAAQVAIKPAEEGAHWWADVRGDKQRFDAGHMGDGFDGDGPAVTVGINWNNGNLVYGGFIGHGRNQVDFGRNNGNFTQTESTIGGVAGWRSGSLWINGQVSFSKLGFDVERDVKLGIARRTHTGSPDGDNLTTAAEAGWDFSMGRLNHGPVIGLIAQRIDVDSFPENSPDLSTSLAYSDQSYDSVLASAGWQASFAATDTVMPYARLTYDREFEDPSEEVFASAQSLRGSLAYAVPGMDFDQRYGTFTMGSRLQLFGLDANLGYQITVGQEDGRRATVYATVGKGF
ncbi:MAG: autotransporter domain-containing protein [Pseudomonadota bacterium]|nr:autotransporter domain-containing protein [Pseudomonadota bacterium]